MKNHVREIVIGNTPIEIKSRTDDRHPSGWSVIAFTPDLSIRSTKLHRDAGRVAFANAILGAADMSDVSDINYKKAFPLIMETIIEVTT
jgi:hypothetical protein